MAKQPAKQRSGRGPLLATVVVPPNRHAAFEMTPFREKMRRATLAIGVTVAGMCLVANSDPDFRLFGYPVVLGGFLLFLASGAWRRKGSEAKIIAGALASSPTGLRLRGESEAVAIDRVEMRHAYAAPVDGGAVVHIARTRQLPVRVTVATMKEAKRIVRQLGLPPATDARPIHASSAWVEEPRLGGAIALGAVGFFCLLCLGGLHSSSIFVPYLEPYIHHAQGWLLALAGVLLGAMVVPFAVSTLVDVKSDGIAIRWLWKRRFIRFTDVQALRSFDEGRKPNARRVGVELVLADGKSVKLDLGHGAQSLETYAPAYAQIADAFRRYRSGGTDVVDAARLERRGRAPAEWVAALHAIGSGANADMRTAPVPEKRLFRIAVDPAAPPALRAGAAVALSKQLSPRARERVRVAAADAPPPLRNAVARACDGADDEALAEALAAIESEPEKARL